MHFPSPCFFQWPACFMICDIHGTVHGNSFITHTFKMRLQNTAPVASTKRSKTHAENPVRNQAKGTLSSKTIGFEVGGQNCQSIFNKNSKNAKAQKLCNKPMCRKLVLTWEREARLKEHMLQTHCQSNADAIPNGPCNRCHGILSQTSITLNAFGVVFDCACSAASLG